MELALQRMAEHKLAKKQGIERFGTWFEARHVFVEGSWRLDDRFQTYNSKLSLQQDSGAYIKTALETLSLLNKDIAQYLPESGDIKSLFALSKRCKSEPKLKEYLQDLALLHEFGVVTADKRFKDSRAPIKNVFSANDTEADGLAFHVENAIKPEFNQILTATADKAFELLNSKERTHAQNITNGKSASGVPLIGRR
jgi:hypothetical protein